MSTTITYLSYGTLVFPILAMLMHFLGIKNKLYAARLATYSMGIGCVVSLASLLFYQNGDSNAWLNFDGLNLLLVNLILWVSTVVHSYSIRYMDGDRLYSRYFITLAAISLSAMVMALAENIYLFWTAWVISNGLLVVLMIHKSEWGAARQSGYLSLAMLFTGSLSLLVSILLMGQTSSSVSMHSIIVTHQALLPIALLLVAGLIQSAIWPFHRWLISSLNSPTPVSALMHAGLVNGGGILMVKFAPLLLGHKHVMLALFLLGALSAILGTIWKLIQTDIKKMLACSTLAQMGFMMMQCGLGLFAAAIAHLCWHGLFKAYLFLSSGSALTQHRHQHTQTMSGLKVLALSSLGGLVGMSSFAWMLNKPVFSMQSSTFVLFFAFMAGAQLLISLIQQEVRIGKIILGMILAALGGLMYGFCVHSIEGLLPNLSNMTLPSLTLTHGLVMILFGGFWVGFNIFKCTKWPESKLWGQIYMYLLNASQPALKTITALRKDYQY